VTYKKYVQLKKDLTRVSKVQNSNKKAHPLFLSLSVQFINEKGHTKVSLQELACSFALLVYVSFPAT
jgi:hypothetical protein